MKQEQNFRLKIAESTAVAKIPKIAITISNSIIVKPAFELALLTGERSLDRIFIISSFFTYTTTLYITATLVQEVFSFLQTKIDL